MDLIFLPSLVCSKKYPVSVLKMLVTENKKAGYLRGLESNRCENLSVIFRNCSFPGESVSSTYTAKQPKWTLGVSIELILEMLSFL